MKRTNLIKLIAIIAILTVVIIIGGTQTPPRIDNYTQYNCDVKNFKLSTNIQISTNSKELFTVSGNILKFIEDPLTMKDTEGNKIAYAGDDYHYIAQDSHAIVVNGNVTAEMVGLVEIFGEQYDIYDTNGNKIAKANFNDLNTAGSIYDTNGKLIATYGSFVLFNDFTIKISNESTIDPNTLLMIFCSYYSDQAYDN